MLNCIAELNRVSTCSAHPFMFQLPFAILCAAGKATEPQHMLGYEEIWQGQLTNALKDLQQRGSLNAWQLPEGPLFTSAAAFRSFLLQQCIPPDLQQLLPGHSTQPAAAAAAAFQKRMQQLLETLGAGRAKAAALWSWE